jgi:hypothetical protein
MRYVMPTRDRKGAALLKTMPNVHVSNQSRDRKGAVARSQA